MVERITEDQEIPVHLEAMSWMIELVLDLKKQLSGLPPSRPITMQRLDEFQKHYSDLNQCQQSMRVY